MIIGVLVQKLLRSCILMILRMQRTVKIRTVSKDKGDNEDEEANEAEEEDADE